MGLKVPDSPKRYNSLLKDAPPAKISIKLSPQKLSSPPKIRVGSYTEMSEDNLLFCKHIVKSS